MRDLMHDDRENEYGDYWEGREKLHGKKGIHGDERRLAHAVLDGVFGFVYTFRGNLEHFP